MFLFFIFIHTLTYKMNLIMTYKSIYDLVSIDKRRAYYKTYYQQTKERYKQRHTETIKLKEHEPSSETNAHNKKLSIMSKLQFQITYLFDFFIDNI